MCVRVRVFCIHTGGTFRFVILVFCFEGKTDKKREKEERERKPNCGSSFSSSTGLVKNCFVLVMKKNASLSFLVVVEVVGMVVVRGVNYSNGSKSKAGLG